MIKVVVNLLLNFQGIFEQHYLEGRISHEQSQQINIVVKGVK